MEIDDGIPHFGRRRRYTITYYGVVCLVVGCIGTFILTGLLGYHLRSCVVRAPLQFFEDDDIISFFRSQSTLKDETQKAKFDGRLPKSILPDTYEVKLVPFIWPGNFTFDGEVKIIVNVTEDTKTITLHAADMDIFTNATRVHEYPETLDGKAKLIGLQSQRNDTAHEFFIIKTNETLKAGRQYSVYMKFTGTLGDDMQGFYRSSYVVNRDRRWIAATQFQPTEGRRVFPCFDEPAFKAKFQISIAHPSNMTAISNMPKTRQSERVDGLPTYVWDHFERSVPMSTYLVAFIVSDFEYASSTEGNLRIWARKEAIQQADYSLSIAPKILKYFEDFFQIKFPLPKIDMIALPDFSAGAMENWGLITYREASLLHQEGVSTTYSKLEVSTILAHELAHQWFGNLVTPTWWSDVWLNEGFASYAQFLGIEAVEPTWKPLEQFIVQELQNVLDLDVLHSSHPISVEVDHPNEISEIFDRISYAKGASLIRMMDHFLTRKTFKRGLTNYLNAKAYGNARQDDLWDAMTKQAHEDKILAEDVTIKQIMDTWTLQTGFPVVTVTRIYGDDSAEIEQERFIFGNKTNDGPVWWIPLTYTTAVRHNFNSTKPVMWMKAEKSVIMKNLGATSQDWIIFNIMETGYYRVNYDWQNWNMISRQLKGRFRTYISTINRAQLVDDALNLARAGLLSYAMALDVTSYLENETEYLPWGAAFVAMTYLDDMLIKSPAYDQFRAFVLRLMSKMYKKIGFEDSLADPQLTVFTRFDMLTWACMLGHEDCVRKAISQFTAWRNESRPIHSNPISPNLRGVVYCTAIQFGGPAEWEFIWQRYLESNVGSEKELLLNALGCTRETWLLSRYLDRILMESSGIRKQDVYRVFVSVSTNIVGPPLIFNFFRNNWVRLKIYFGSSLISFTNLIKFATKRMNTKHELKELLEFTMAHVHEVGTSSRAIEQAIEEVEENIRWYKRNLGNIQTWLSRNVS